MRLILLLAVLLAGCATTPLTPSSVNPAVTQATNAVLCLARASSGDCTKPCLAPTLAACNDLPATATVADAQTALQACFLAAAEARGYSAIAAAQAALCARPVIPQPVVPLPPPLAKPGPST
jgi:hypothetical protein